MFLADLFEVKAKDINLLSNSELTELVINECDDMNWQYDIDPFDEVVFDAGLAKLKKIEGYLAELFLRNKTDAMNLWESNCPFAIPGIIPSFLRQK